MQHNYVIIRKIFNQETNIYLYLFNYIHIHTYYTSIGLPLRSYGDIEDDHQDRIITFVDGYMKDNKQNQLLIKIFSIAII